MENYKALLLKAPDTQLDRSMLPLIEKWDDQPKAIQILEVLDHCVHGSLASNFVIFTLEILLDGALAAEGITRELLVSQAVWRNER